MKDVLIHQQKYMQYKLKKPFDKTVCKFVYAATTLNGQWGKLPPSFNDTQKIQDSEFLYAVHANADKEYKDIVKFHGFQLGNGNTDDYIEMCERASQDDCSESSGDEYARKQTSRKKKDKRKSRVPNSGAHNENRENRENKFKCSHHGWNPTHSSDNCYTLNKKKKAKNAKGRGKRNSNEVLMLEETLAKKNDDLAIVDGKFKLQKKVSRALHSRMKVLEARLN